MTKETQLHEILAVEQDLMTKANGRMAETMSVFANGSKFEGRASEFTPFNEGEKHLAESDRHEVTTTVPARLAFTAQSIGKHLDIVFQKDIGNQEARADIVVDGQTIAVDVPATTLLTLENRLRRVHEVFARMPTLDNKIAWEKAEEIGEDIWRTKFPAEKFRTRKVTKPVVLYEATEHHPAQVKEVTEDVPWGKFSQTDFSGCVTSARANEILTKLDKLIRAVKRARSKANKAVIDTKASIGKALFDYVLG